MIAAGLFSYGFIVWGKFAHGFIELSLFNEVKINNDKQPMRKQMLFIISALSASFIWGKSMVATENYLNNLLLIAILILVMYEDFSISAVILSVSLHFHSAQFDLYHDNKHMWGTA